jgi:hypothetical protein
VNSLRAASMRLLPTVACMWWAAIRARRLRSAGVRSRDNAQNQPSRLAPPRQGVGFRRACPVSCTEC